MTEDPGSGGESTTGGGPLRRRFSGPPPTRPARAQVVVGWNRDETSAVALRYAVALAHRLGAHVHVVHIVDLDDTPVDPDAPDWDAQIRSRLANESRAARDLLDTLEASWTYHSGHGAPADLLVRVAEACDALMVVIGSSRGGLASRLDAVLGQSVSQRLIGARAVPLLLVPVDTRIPTDDHEGHG